MSEPSVFGNIADLGEGQVLLPSFVSRREDGVYVDLTAIDSRSLILQFVERVFGVGTRFVDLDYELFLNLVFLWEPADVDRQVSELKRRGKPPQVRLARDIVPFPEERRGIYHGVKILAGGESAEYIIEQISIEREVEDPDAPDGSGRRKISERLYADFDEFVAALWEKGVHFGIDAQSVREAIARDKAERTTVAHMVVPTQGKDAGIDEQTDLLHRDDAPRILPNGRMDLRHYRNRFPQVKAGTRLFKKIPRVVGVSGWNVQGKELLPVTVKDFDIETLAGIGTQVVKEGDSFYVIAAQDGFLDIDVKSHQISVVPKIIHREGVSMRTTGDLSLDGEQYEEHGEVQEKRVVEGHNMTFLADVFGNVLSDGGRIAIKQNISGGTVHTPGGSVVVDGFASRAMLEARGGEVVVSRAEGSFFIAAKVRIERAVRCDIVADEVEIELAEGCAIAAKKVVIKTSTMRKEESTNVTMLLPDSAHIEAEAKRLNESCRAIETEIARHGAAIQAFVGQPDMKSFFAIQARLKAQSLTMTAPQQVQWQAMQKRVAPILQKVAALNDEMRQAREKISGIEAQIEALAAERIAAAQDISCAIAAVTGDTRVHTLRRPFDAPPLATLTPKALHALLHEAGESASRLFSGSSGSFEWQPPTQKEAAKQGKQGPD